MTPVAIALSETTPEDLETLFRFQLDPDANYLAAFTSLDSANRAAYLAKYGALLTDPTVTMRTVRVGEEIAGSIAKFMVGHKAEVTYWLDRKWWGQGVATRVLRRFLEQEPTRPLYGRVAGDNYGSQKVLVNGGFVKIGTDKGFANARQTEIEEFIYELTR